MPGQTDNDLAIDALNQAIVALNEIGAGFGDGSNIEDIEANLLLAAQNIDEVRVALETHGIAAITAQNTNFIDLVAAIQGIEQCPPLITNPTFFSFETELQPEQGTEFQQPPMGWIETAETPGSMAYFDRKCGYANLVADNLYYICDTFNDYNVNGISALGVGIVTGLIVGVLTAPAAGPFAAIIGVVGGIAAIVATFMAGGIDYLKLRNTAQAGRSDIVCAAYDAVDAATARSDIIQVFTDDGANSVEQLFIGQLLDFSGYLNMLFFDRENNDVPNEPDPPYTTDCDGCGGSCSPQVFFGNVDFTPGLRTWSSEPDGTGASLHTLYFCYCPTSAQPSINLEFKAINGYTSLPSQYWDFRVHSDCSPINVEGDVYLSAKTPPPLDTPFCFNQLVFWSLTPFTVDVDITGEC